MTAPVPSDRLLRHALAYTRRGWAVLPLWWPTATGDCACGVSDCDSTGSHPVQRLVSHGLRDGTDREDTVSRWWRSVPAANVAIRTGGPRGPVVLDVDGALGELALRGLVACHGLFQAWWVRTGSGGWHAYFGHPGIPVPTSAGRVGEGLDVHGEGGYVVAPPSVHATLRPYRWVGAERDMAEPAGELPAMPAWLLALAVSGERQATALQPVRLRSGDVSAFTAAVIDREAREVSRAPYGRRGSRLHRAAFRLGQLVGAGLADERMVTDALVAAALAAGPGERRARFTVRRSVRAGMLQPRRVELHGADREAEA